MSNKLAERPQAPKEFDGNRQDSGTRGTWGSYPNDTSKAETLEAKWRAQASQEATDVYMGVDEYYDDASGEYDWSDPMRDEMSDEIQDLKTEYPSYNELTPLMTHYVEEHVTNPAEMDEDTLATFYANFLSRKHGGKSVDINDAHTLLYELLYERRNGSETLDNQAEDEAYELNETVYTEAALEDEAYTENELRYTSYPDQPVRRTRNRNLVRAAKRLTDDK